MGNNTSTQSNETPPPTPASSFFNLANPPVRRRTRKRDDQPSNAYPPRRSMFLPDENEPDDSSDAPAVLLGWTQTEQGIVIPQIRSIPLASPLDDTIFNSPRPPWVERRSRSPVPSARSIPRMRQFSIDSLRTSVTTRRELRVVNASRPTTATSLPGQRMSLITSEDDDSEYEVPYESRAPSFEWHHPQVRESQENNQTKQPLKRYNSTNDSGYSSMSGYSERNPGTATDTASETDESVDPWWWEEAAGYTSSPTELVATEPQTVVPSADTDTLIPSEATLSPSKPSHNRTSSLSTSILSASTSSSKTRVLSTKLVEPVEPPTESLQYLCTERQESFQISTLLRNHPVDEWSEWREKVTHLLMIPEEDDTQESPKRDKPLPPVPRTPTSSSPFPTETSRSPTRRRSLFNFAKVAKFGISKRKSVLW